MQKRKAQEIVRQMRRFYNTAANEWNASRNTPTPVKLKAIKTVEPGMRVLDLGCGNGLMAGPIMNRGGQYVGADFSTKLTAGCKKRFASHIKTGQAEFITANAVKLPFRNNAFDFAVSIAVMHHIPSFELRLKFLRELYRVLKSGATAKIDNWNLREDWGKKKYGISKQLANPAEEYDEGDVSVPWKATGGKELPRYIHIFSDRELRNLARAAGFKKIKIEYFNRAGVKTKNGEAQILTIKK
jgi:ubiquinone/menaquinone biosynthesis C-methylase UbiE